jgi:DNA-binding IclR family transcriptional regulator
MRRDNRFFGNDFQKSYHRAMPRKAEASDNVSALTRGFEVLNCFAAARRPLGNGELAQATGIPRPTVSRLVATLVSLGHLRPARESDKYELAAGVVRLAEAFLGAIDVRAYARPHLVALAEATGASAFLGVRDGDEMLVVEAGRARSAVAVIGADVGTRMSLATSALGRAWLAGVDAPTRAAVLASWPANRALDAALAEARRGGFALSLGEWHPNINAVAVPVRTPGGEVVTINCGSPSFVMPAQRLHEFVIPRLVAAADAFAADIGGVAGYALTAAQPESPPSTKAPAKRRRLSPTGV